jgi:hypothetical protein
MEACLLPVGMTGQLSFGFWQHLRFLCNLPGEKCGAKVAPGVRFFVSGLVQFWQETFEKLLLLLGSLDIDAKYCYWITQIQRLKTETDIKET